MPSLDAFATRFNDLPPAVMLKVDLLRLGVRLGAPPVGTRHYHHHDERGQKSVDPRVHLQGSVVLPDGTTVFVTHNPGSPYAIRLNLERGTLELTEGPDEAATRICDVTAGGRFHWTGARTSQDTPLGAVFSQSLGGTCGPLAIFLLRYCEFVKDNQECRFCSWVRMGRSHEVRPNVDDMREALDTIWREQHAIGYLAFSGGSLFNRSKEADAFVRYMEAARSTGLPLPTTVAAIQALDRDDTRRLRDAGFDYACYSMEVWDEDAWRAVLPGKAESVGRDRWMRCLVDAVEEFGPGRVLCNFVAGVETAVPGLYRSSIEAAEHTLAGIQWCYEHGIYPKLAVWIVSGGAAFGDRSPAPLEYYAHLLRGRQRLYAEYDLPVPATDCRHCLTQSCEADLAVLDRRWALGAAGDCDWDHRHPVAATNA
jgi:hypothetical protein